MLLKERRKPKGLFPSNFILRLSRVRNFFTFLISGVLHSGHFGDFFCISIRHLLHTQCSKYWVFGATPQPLQRKCCSDRILFTLINDFLDILIAISSHYLWVLCLFLHWLIFIWLKSIFKGHTSFGVNPIWERLVWVQNCYEFAFGQCSSSWLC